MGWVLIWEFLWHGTGDKILAMSDAKWLKLSITGPANYDGSWSVRILEVRVRCWSSHAVLECYQQAYTQIHSWMSGPENQVWYSWIIILVLISSIVFLLLHTKIFCLSLHPPISVYLLVHQIYKIHTTRSGKVINARPSSANGNHVSSDPIICDMKQESTTPPIFHFSGAPEFSKNTVSGRNYQPQKNC